MYNFNKEFVKFPRLILFGSASNALQKALKFRNVALALLNNLKQLP